MSRKTETYKSKSNNAQPRAVALASGLRQYVARLATLVLSLLNHVLTRRIVFLLSVYDRLPCPNLVSSQLHPHYLSLADMELLWSWHIDDPPCSQAAACRASEQGQASSQLHSSHRSCACDRGAREPSRFRAGIKGHSDAIYLSLTISLTPSLIQ